MTTGPAARRPAAPEWWTKGVPRLQMEDHLKQRLEEQDKRAVAAAPVKSAGEKAPVAQVSEAKVPAEVR